MIGAEECALLCQVAAAEPGALDVYVDWLLTHDPVRGPLLQQRLKSDPKTVTPEEKSAWYAALDQRSFWCESIEFDPLPIRMTIAGTHLASIEAVLDRLPFMHVQIVFSGVRIADVFASPVMAKIRSLSWRAESYAVDDEENYQSLITTYFGDEVVAALCASPNVTQLEVLWVGGDKAGAQCAAQLAAVPFTQLRWLSIYEEPIGDAGAVALAKSSMAATLRRLNLMHCKIGDDGARALAGSLTCIEQLLLYGNNIGPEGAAALRALPTLKHVEGLPT